MRVPELAARLGVTDRHLRRVFAQVHGVTPIGYLTTQRLLLAKQLLTDTALPVTQVALSCGFESLRRFKDIVEEVRSGTECGIAVKAYNDVKPGDVIDASISGIGQMRVKVAS